MAILYAFQATGNGHVSRAKTIIPILKRYGEVEVLASGTQSSLLKEIPVNYHLQGLSFHYGQRGDLNYFSTVSQIKLRQFWNDIHKISLNQYQLIINDFEPVTAWAALKTKKNIVGLSHQASLLSPLAPRPTQKSKVGELLLRHFAPAPVQYGFHFGAYDHQIFTPVIREEIRALNCNYDKQVQVYLPALDDWTLVQIFIKIPEQLWIIYSRNARSEIAFRNIKIKPISSYTWVEDLASSGGVIMGAGFEGPAEVLHLGLKLLVLPIKGQYEQYCNAEALARLGVPVIWAPADLTPQLLRQWLWRYQPPDIHYEDQTEKIIAFILERHYDMKPNVFASSWSHGQWLTPNSQYP